MNHTSERHSFRHRWDLQIVAHQIYWEQDRIRSQLWMLCEIVVPDGSVRLTQHTIEKSTPSGSNVTEFDISVWEEVNDLTTSGSGMGDIENGRHETSIPCWRRSSEVKGTASSSNIGWEKERVDRGSKEKPVTEMTGLVSCERVYYG